jgi:hypothetical protein
MPISQIVTNSIADSAVVTVDIANGAVTQAKLGTGVAGNGPAFSSALTSDQTLSNNTVTKLTLNTEVYDTNNCYDPTTNYRFTPNVAGYYLINLKVLLGGTGTRNYAMAAYIYKNGSSFTYSPSIMSITVGSGGDNSLASSMLIYMNGSTDYLEAYAYQFDYTASSTMLVKAFATNFNGVLARAA